MINTPRIIEIGELQAMLAHDCLRFTSAEPKKLREALRYYEIPFKMRLRFVIHANMLYVIRVK